MRPDYRRLDATAGPGAQGPAAALQTAILIRRRDQPLQHLALADPVVTRQPGQACAVASLTQMLIRCSGSPFGPAVDRLRR